MSNTVLVDTREAVATLTLNRPAVLNALNPEMAKALKNTLLEIGADQGIHCVVIRGAGDHFMAGGDVKFFHESLVKLAHPGSDAIAPIIEDVHSAIRALRGMDKPVVASVRGAVAGFGVSLVAACDLGICAEDAMFTLAYCHIGTSPDGGATYFLPRIVGLKRGMELALLGERFDIKQALQMGLVNWAIPAQELEAATDRLARQLAAGPAYAYAKTKALLNASFGTSLEAQLEAEKAAFMACTKTKDFAEGVTAFCEKRKPQFFGL